MSWRPGSPTPAQRHTIRAEAGFNKVRGQPPPGGGVGEQVQAPGENLDAQDLLKKATSGCRSLSASSTIPGATSFTYAYWWIHSHHQGDQHQRQHHQLPAHLAEKLSKIRTFSYRHMAEFSTNPTRQQLPEHVRMDDEELAYVANLYRMRLSIKNALKTAQS